MLLLILLGSGCAVIVLGIFCLVKAGRRANDGEEGILEVISPAPREGINEDTSIQTPEVAAIR